MPAYCAPCPVKRKAIRGGSRRATRAVRKPACLRRCAERNQAGAQLVDAARGMIVGTLGEVGAAGVGGEADVGQVSSVRQASEAA